MPITSLKFRPGINKETTSYSNKGGWNDCDLIRFRFGYPEKLGGWEKYSSNTFLGVARSLHAWANLEGNKYLGFGTQIKFYIEESEGFKDITPLRRKVVGGKVVFDINGKTIEFDVTGSTGTGGVGTVVIESVYPVKSTNPENNLRILGTTELGTVTINTPPTSANLFGTGAVGTVIVEISNESTVVVGD
jgi:hypothetical protein|tara:strand:+ start:6313 stop:6882 length:570 start_codon:yes stop_codon:yes gene_type:complete